MSNALWDRVVETATRRGDAAAVVQGADTWSFADLATGAETLSGAFVAHGVGAGDRVVLARPNTAEVLMQAAAAWRLGAMPVLLHADAPPAHCAHVAAVTRPALILAQTVDGWPRDAALRAPGEALDAAPAPAPVARAGDDPGSIVFTSGSTGLPKGVTQRGATLIERAAAIGALLGYGDDDSILCPVPFAFDYGWGQALSCLLDGRTLILPEGQGGLPLCAALKDHAPTVLAGVPAVFADLTLGLAPIRETPRDSIRLITNTGSKIPPPVFTELRSLFPGARLSLNYGLTETYRSASLPVDLADAHSDAVGHAVPGADILIVGEDGRPLPRGEEGEIVHRGAGTFHGYWGDPDRTAEVLRPDPEGGDAPAVFTGDLGHIGEDGLLRVTGRRDRQMKSMGVRVSPDEVEALLTESGLLAEVGVVAEKHDVLGDMIVACLVPRADAPEGRALIRAISKHARASLSPYMMPRRWEVFDALPRTRSAKVDYPALTRAVEARN